MRTALSLLVLVAPLGAQQVWIVDDTAATAPDFTSLQTAIDTVAAGDVLLVRQGTYSGMDLRKGMTIAVEGPNQVVSLPAGQSVHLRGLELLGYCYGEALRLSDCDGTVWVEACQMLGEEVSAGLFVFRCRSVALLGVTAIGGQGDDCSAPEDGPGPGLVVSSSSVHAYGSFFEGNDGKLTNQCIFHGGGPCGLDRRGSEGAQVGGAAATLVLSGCVVRGGASPCDYDYCGDAPSPNPGGPGLVVHSGSVHVLDSTLEGGPGSVAEGAWGENPCPGPQGPAHVGPVSFLPGRELSVTPLAPTRENQSVTLHVEGPPHVLVRLGSSDRPATMPYLDLLRGTLFLGLSPAGTVRTLGVTNAAGVLDAPLTVGPFPPGVEAQLTYYQPFYLDYDRWRVRRIGVPLDTFVLGQGTLLLGLDESF